MSEKAKRIRDAVKWYIVAEELIPRDGLVLAAVSGGQDSMAMVYILSDLTRELRFRLAVGHFNHKLRESSDKDKAVVEQFARRLALSFYYGEEDVGSLASASGDSIEEAGRKARYRFLSRLADDTGAARIATGHTRDDHIETVLMRILRGTGIRGVGGIPTRRGRIIRPLLGLRRDETREFCEAQNIPYIVDATNADPKFIRNRIRIELIPMLKTFNPAVEENVLRLARNAQEMIQTIRSTTSPLIKKKLKHTSANEWVFNISGISSLDETSMFVLFSDIFAEHLSCDLDFARVHYEQLAALAKDPKGSGKMLTLPGVTVKREFENLVLSRSVAGATVPDAAGYKATLTLPGETRIPGGVVKTEILENATIRKSQLQASDRVAYFPLHGLTLPLVLRSPTPGDRMRPFGMTGTKKLSDIFIDKKIPGRDRAKALLLTDSKEILWLVGVAASEISRLEPGTEKVVKITVQLE